MRSDSRLVLRLQHPHDRVLWKCQSQDSRQGWFSCPIRLAWRTTHGMCCPLLTRFYFFSVSSAVTHPPADTYFSQLGVRLAFFSVFFLVFFCTPLPVAANSPSVKIFVSFSPPKCRLSLLLSRVCLPQCRQRDGELVFFFFSGSHAKNTQLKTSVRTQHNRRQKRLDYLWLYNAFVFFFPWFPSSSFQAFIFFF